MDNQFFHKLQQCGVHLLLSKELPLCVNYLSDPINKFSMVQMIFSFSHVEGKFSELRREYERGVGGTIWWMQIIKKLWTLSNSSQKRCIFILFALFRRTFSRRQRLPVIHTYVWNFCRAYKAVYIMQHIASSPVLFFCLPIWKMNKMLYKVWIFISQQ